MHSLHTLVIAPWSLSHHVFTIPRTKVYFNASWILANSPWRVELWEKCVVILFTLAHWAQRKTMWFKGTYRGKYSSWSSQMKKPRYIWSVTRNRQLFSFKSWVAKHKHSMSNEHWAQRKTMWFKGTYRGKYPSWSSQMKKPRYIWSVTRNRQLLSFKSWVAKHKHSMSNEQWVERDT